MTIVGHKIERYLTAVKRDYGGHWDVTHHQVITQLHATKGWRQVSHERKLHHVKRLPPPDQWRAARVTEYIPQGREEPKLPKWSRPDRGEIPLREQHRHRERCRDLRIAANRALNAEEDRQIALATQS